MRELSRGLSEESMMVFKAGRLTDKFMADYEGAVKLGRKWGEVG